MRLLKLLLGVIKPTEAKNMKDVLSAVEDWENKVARLEEEYGEKINDNLKVAILLAIVPEALQEKVFDHLRVVRTKLSELVLLAGSETLFAGIQPLCRAYLIV